MFKTIKELMQAARAAHKTFKDFHDDDGVIIPPPELENFVTDDHYFVGKEYLLLQDRADWQGSRTELRNVIAKAVHRMRRMGIPMYVHTVYRSPALQAKLKAKGFSKVTSGAHQRSDAADVVHAHYHWADERQTKGADDFWALWGRTVKDVARAENVAIVWGGDWKFYDPAHVELKDWRDREPIEPGDPVRYSTEYIRHHKGL
jgi:hypothetical protein